MIALCLLLGISVVGRHGALRTGGVAGLILVCAASSLSPKIRHTDNSKLSSVGVSVRADARLGVISRDSCHRGIDEYKRIWAWIGLGHVGCRTAKVVALLQKSGAQLFLYDRPVSGDALQIAAIMLIGRTMITSSCTQM